ncbi:MAG: diguanylate cyclase [Candidatus Aminicenantes bacterium]|nr:MAG: diguanylate cyclase [Candidatus Aminicenantes bacterium]
MNDQNILILNEKTDEVSLLEKICGRLGSVFTAPDLEKAIHLIESRSFQVVVVDWSLAHYSKLKGLFMISTSIIITGEDEQKLKSVVSSWPLRYYVDHHLTPTENWENNSFLRTLTIAFEHSLLRKQLKKLKRDREKHEFRLQDAYSQIKEIKSFINNNIVKEIEKRVFVEEKYQGIKKEKQRIEETLKKLYIANDVTSLLDIVYDIKDIVRAEGISLYILDENETLGQYLKPLVWDDAFLSHPEFSKHFVLIDSDDFAAYSTRHREEINTSDISSDKRYSRRYADQLKLPLESILCVPIMQDTKVIGVIEVYNKIKTAKEKSIGFSAEDQKAMNKFSEHISIAITKLNLIQYDALTGLLRPDPFFDKVIQKLNLERKRHTEGSSYAMVMGDVDWFKNYNDRYGHEAGNKLLRTLAGVLQLSIREEDLLCRYGGEEFLIFLSGLNSEDEASGFTERIRKNIEEYHFENQQTQPNNNITMSFGLTFFSKRRIRTWDMINKTNLKRLTNEADIALAEAKGKKFLGMGRDGIQDRLLLKNRVCVFDKGKAEKPRKPESLKQYMDKFIKERRKHQRFYTSTILIYKEKDFHKVTKTINLSLSGAKIPTEAQLNPEKTLELILILGNNACQLKGDVVYSELAGEEYFHYFTGIRFKDLAMKEKKILEDYFASLNLNTKPLPH